MFLCLSVLLFLVLFTALLFHCLSICFIVFQQFHNSTFDYFLELCALKSIIYKYYYQNLQ